MLVLVQGSETCQVDFLSAIKFQEKLLLKIAVNTNKGIKWEISDFRVDVRGLEL